MSPRAVRWALFAVLVFVWPLPLVGLEGSFVPVARFAQLAAALSILVGFEGAGGMVGAMLGLLWAHVIVYGVLLYIVAASWVHFVISRLPPSTRTGFVVVSLLGMLLWGVFGRPYDTLFHHASAHASLLDLYR